MLQSYPSEQGMMARGVLASLLVCVALAIGGDAASGSSKDKTYTGEKPDCCASAALQLLCRQGRQAFVIPCLHV